jgi:hypothetical protein
VRMGMVRFHSLSMNDCADEFSFFSFSVDPPADPANEAEGDVDAVGDESMLADVIMSEGGM